ncbi:uncharacterized protein [Dermacentor andersoni]|uniref:uncharacterized protein n=1 Tax=Dermacentor andersoni TaxID=34620 RepID=UPI0021556F31|nr:uncharacterized protein LOC126544768 [Dermacentor andersoni]
MYRTMELVREFGDPQVLVLSEDHIVLKLETAWSRDVAVPEGLSLADDGGQLMVARRRSLASLAKNKLLRQATISKALFCGCVSFDSCERYASASSELLRGTQEICIVHNRDTVHKLIRMFPKVKVLALPHDLCIHALEIEEPCGDRLGPLVVRCQLRELVGNIGGLCEGRLLLSPWTTLALIRTCPDVRRIDSMWLGKCFTEPCGLTTSTDRRSKNLTHLWLGCLDNSSGGRLHNQMGPMIAVDVRTAADKFPSVENLQLAVESLEEIANVPAFCNLHSITIEISPALAFADASSQLQKMLARLPGLEELALENCGGVRLSTISRLCPKLKTLRLVRCLGSQDDTPVGGNGFPSLECVDVSMDMLTVAFGAFLSATHDRLRTACLGHNGMCLEFLRHCVRYGRHQPFTRLEHLTLNTKLSLPQLDIQPQDLHDVMKALPALRHLETDSYDLRLFTENYCVPRGRVSLSWTGCVHCAVHRPELAFCERLAAFVKDSFVPCE